MHIVLDANIIIGAGYGSSHQFRLLLSTLEGLSHVLCIPRVVIEEVVGKFSREINDDVREIRRRLSNLSWRLDKDMSSTFDELDEMTEVSPFRERLEAQFDRILDYPETQHEVLVRRAVTRTKPFDEEGEGFRDALIWETVLKLASEVDSEVVLISSDNDFSNRKRGLHNDLLIQMDERGVSRDKVILFHTLSSFIGYIGSRLPEGTLE